MSRGPTLDVHIQLLNPQAKIPTKGEGDAGYDLYSIGMYTIYQGECLTIPLGVSMEFPETHAALLWDKSGLAANRQIHMLGGVIDSNYRGEWHVTLMNLGNGPYTIKPGDKIIQVLFQRVDEVAFLRVDRLSESNRGTRGFSSGK